MQYLPSILAALGILCNLFLGLYVFSSNKKAAKDQELQDTKNRVVSLEGTVQNMPDKVADDLELQHTKTRLTSLETQVKNMPDHEDYGELRVDIAALQSELKGMVHTLESVDKTANRIQDFLLNNK